MRTLDELLAPRGYSVEDGVVQLQTPEAEIRLHNVIHEWTSVRTAERPDVLAQFVNQLLAAVEREPAAGDKVLDVLRPRLWHSETMRQLRESGTELYSRPVAIGLEAVLSLDLPETVVNLQPEEAAATGLSEDDLWDRALAQIDDGIPVDHQELENIRILHGESFFITSRALDLERFVGPLGTDGAIVVLPRRHMMAWRPVSDGDVMWTVLFILTLANQQFDEGPGSLTPEVYWWHDGILELLHVDMETDPDRPEIQGSDAFIDMMERTRPH